jgi:hypothetical protein
MADDIPRWTRIERWLQLQHGMSEADVLDLLGPPTKANQSGADERRYRYGVVREGGNELHSCGWVDFEGTSRGGFRLTKWTAPDLSELEPPAGCR